ncbi:hypothetical protein [Anaerotruncus rubiinfantis]|uniref:hypothetical protein n=1 Tax=Anaerotruncus rubiinfantis TaxID=1720200 RepID=UPI0018980BB1|nr:hypothetical protein [Anaerotruncus rubiinfantis]
MNNKARVHIEKYISYIALITILFVLQTTPGFLAIFGIKPNFVVPAAVCIAMMEDEFIGGLYGAFAGVLCDLGGFTLFGFNAILIMAGCVAVGLLSIYLLRMSAINFVLLVAGVLLARGLLDYLLNFYMWGYEGVWRVLCYRILPGVIYSAAAAPLCYWLFTRMRGYFEARIQS